MILLARYLLVQGHWTNRPTRRKLRDRQPHRTETSSSHYTNHHWADNNCNEPLHKTPSTSPSKHNHTNSYHQFNNHNANQQQPQQQHQRKKSMVVTSEMNYSDPEDIILSECGLTRERGSFRMALRRGLGPEPASQPSSPSSETYEHVTPVSSRQRRGGGDMMNKEYLRTSDWVLLASILDRVFFLIFFTINLIAASVIFTRAIP